jgi:hypothetical protein
MRIPDPTAALTMGHGQRRRVGFLILEVSGAVGVVSRRAAVGERHPEPQVALPELVGIINVAKAGVSSGKSWRSRTLRVKPNPVG